MNGAIEVMIVDDEPAGRRALRECCAAEPDLRITGEFGDGITALDAIRQTPPQLLFLDIQMDTISGIELARRLDPATLPLIVFVTAYDHYALDAFEVSATDYLLKPFDEDRFRRTLVRVRQRYTAPMANTPYKDVFNLITTPQGVNDFVQIGTGVTKGWEGDLSWQPSPRWSFLLAVSDVDSRNADGTRIAGVGTSSMNCRQARMRAR